MNLKELKIIAEKVINKTNELIQYSSNLDNQNKDLRNDDLDLMHRRLAINASRKRQGKNPAIKKFVQTIFDAHIDLESDQVREKFELRWLDLFNLIYTIPKAGSRYEKYETNKEYLRACEEIAANAIKFNIGNCQEKSMLALLLFREFAQTTELEISDNEKISVRLLYYDLPRDFLKENQRDISHDFVMINLNIDADINEPSTWNEDALFGDAWNKQVYTVKEARESLAKFPIWEEVEYCKQFIAELPTDSYIGIQNNNNQPHSTNWDARSRRLEHEININTKWWKRGSFWEMKRPRKEKENLSEVFGLLPPKKKS